MNDLAREIVSAGEVRLLLSALTALRKGDSTVRLQID